MPWRDPCPPAVCRPKAVKTTSQKSENFYATVDTPAGTWVLPKVPDTFFQSYLLGLIRGLYRQTKYVSGASDNIIDEYAIVINMACGGALVMAL